MKSFEDFRNGILGKIYKRKHVDDKIYLVVDVCGRKDSSDIDAKINTANVAYICVSVPDKNITTSFYSDNDYIQVSSVDVRFNCVSVLNNFSEFYSPEPRYSIEDVVNCYKTANANIKDLLRGVGAEL